MVREKSKKAVERDIELEVEQIADEFEDFIDGTRVIFLIERKKEGGHNKKHRRRLMIDVVHSPEQFKKALYQMLIIKYFDSRPLRIYLSVNDRNLKMAEKHMKMMMLQVSFSDEEQNYFLYRRFFTKWLSALMQTGSRNSKYFLLDIDDIKEENDVLKFLAENDIEIIKKYFTKNGIHIITEPFNPALKPQHLLETSIHKDDMMLISY